MCMEECDERCKSYSVRVVCIDVYCRYTEMAHYKSAISHMNLLRTKNILLNCNKFANHGFAGAHTQAFEKLLLVRFKWAATKKKVVEEPKVWKNEKLKEKKINFFFFNFFVFTWINRQQSVNIFHIIRPDRPKMKKKKRKDGTNMLRGDKLSPSENVSRKWKWKIVHVSMSA